jgi:hypothetical protein
MLGARTRPRAASARRRETSGGAGAVIPYDAAASFRLTGRPGNLVQDVINISTDGSFVAVGIGYGFEEDRERPILPKELLDEISPTEPPVIVGDVQIGRFPLASLIEGFRINPRFAHWVFGRGATGDQAFDDGAASVSGVPAERVFGELLQRIKPSEELSFLFSLVDTATGREFQDQASHNLASLGKSNGERPFRLLAHPFHFAPRSTLRVQITERTAGVQGTLFIVLYGYRVLGTGLCPEPIARRLRGAPLFPVESIGSPGARVVPFDYVARLQLTGQRGNQLEEELPINADGAFVATNIGYGLAIDQRDVRMQLDAARQVQDPGLRDEVLEWKAGTLVDLNHLPLRLFPSSALLDGIRIRAGWLRVALQNNGTLSNELPFEHLDRIFERLNVPQDVSFRYALFDTGTGRELQNQRINNIAGLGIADGDRPFKRLARPMIFLPRSTIRVEVEEYFGRGAMFMVFQGYKLFEQQAVGK